MCQQIWKMQQCHRTGKGQFSFQSQRKAIPKNAQTASQLQSSHMLVMLKILQARLQQCVNCELPDVQAGFRKGRGTRDQIANICWIIEKARESQKKHLLLYWLCLNFACVDHKKLDNSSRDGNTRPPDLRNLYAGQEAKIRTRHGTTDWFQFGKGVCQACIWLSCL